MPWGGSGDAWSSWYLNPFWLCPVDDNRQRKCQSIWSFARNAVSCTVWIWVLHSFDQTEPSQTTTDRSFPKYFHDCSKQENGKYESSSPCCLKAKRKKVQLQYNNSLAEYSVHRMFVPIYTDTAFYKIQYSQIEITLKTSLKMFLNFHK